MVFFLERLKARYEERWHEDVNISGAEDLNTDAEFESVIDPETGELEFVYPSWKHNAKVAASSVLWLIPAGVVVAAGLGALELRAHLVLMVPGPYGGITAGLATAAAVYVASRLVGLHWSGVLAHWENHTRASGFVRSRARKAFALEALAHLAPVLYLAVLNAPVLSAAPPANERSILDALTVQATTVFLAYFLCAAGAHMYNTYAWGLTSTVVAEKLGSPQGGPDFSHEEQSTRPLHRGQLQSGIDTSVLLIYSLVLAPICPVAPAFSYLWILHRLSWDKHALVYRFQRPHPQCAPNGGFWPDSLSIIVVLALAVQIPLVLFCSKALSYWIPFLTLKARWGLAASLELAVAAGAPYLYLGRRAPVEGRAR